MYNLENTYPFNMMIEIYCEDKPEAYDICVSKVEEVISGLRKNEQLVIKGRFIENKTFKECGEMWGVSTSRARQVYNMALRRLRHPSMSRRLQAVSKKDSSDEISEDRKNIIREYDYIKEVVSKLLWQLQLKGIDTKYMIKELDLSHGTASERFLSMISLDIDCMNFSERTRNALYRAGIWDVQDLMICTKTQLMDIRNIGVGALEEIESRLLAMYNIVLKD